MRARIIAMSVGLVTLCVLGYGVATAHAKSTGRVDHKAKVREVKISVTEAGFVPASVTVKKGVPFVLVVTRKTDQTCAKQAVFASIGKAVELPLNKAVRVSFPAQSAGRLSYACGMDMLRGELVVR